MKVKSPPPAEPLIELERFLPYRLNVAAEAVSQALSRIYAERYEITIPEWRTISTLGQYQRMTARDIGSHSRMHKTKVSRAVAALVRKQLVTRHENSDDRREAFLVLTEKGLSVYRAIVPEALAFAESLFDGLSPDERALVEQLLIELERRAGNRPKLDEKNQS